jgi:hypothetical protein
MHETSSVYMVPRVNAPLPPLNALRAFEAAARLLSFIRAAHELHVTQTAVSHQMRVLRGPPGRAPVPSPPPEVGFLVATGVAF